MFGLCALYVGLSLLVRLYVLLVGVVLLIIESSVKQYGALLKIAGVERKDRIVLVTHRIMAFECMGLF